MSPASSKLRQTTKQALRKKTYALLPCQKVNLLLPHLSGCSLCSLRSNNFGNERGDASLQELVSAVPRWSDAEIKNVQIFPARLGKVGVL
jgi:hypothetical protein